MGEADCPEVLRNAEHRTEGRFDFHRLLGLPAGG
ncbi:hypothetical protein EDD96_0067 [Streptomyces sp. Ag109_G2-6]|nr:hypothetical protein EDD96_0067 [Streptomyces sp. Ag109_G2-6]